MVAAFIGGELCNFLTKGLMIRQFWLKRNSPEYAEYLIYIKAPFRGMIVLPPSIGQVLFGVMARALYGPLTDHYPIVAS